MSAIAGVYLFNGDSVDEKDLKRMNDSMPHRGPDGSGLWHDGSVGLAHQMLWTTPESLHEKLPFEADKLVITSDSRIDNREELLPELGLSEEVSDSEVILKAYGRWGRKCVDRLLGDFAFVIWDKSKEELFCARDHMGVKPFYYCYQADKSFTFATEIKALFAWGVPREINEAKIGDRFERITNDQEITSYRMILRLPPANFLIIAIDGLCKKRYWDLDPEHEIRFGSDEAYSIAFREIFTKAVTCRLRSVFPVGSMLSGGLDSSSIVCVSRKLLPRKHPLKTFSIIFDTIKECDERQYIDSVLDKGDLEAHYILGDEIGPLTEIEKMLWHEDQPSISPNLFLHWAVMKECNHSCVRILLDGTGGDEAISYGDSFITELARKRRLVTMIREIKGLSRNKHRPYHSILMEYAISPFIPESFKRLYSVLRRRENPFQSDFIVNIEFAKRIGLEDRKIAFQNAELRPTRTQKEDHWLGLKTGLHQLTLEEANMASSAFSLELRFPFYDKRLIEFCLALPAEQKIRHGWTRWILRNSLKEIIPKEIFYRHKKTSFLENFEYGLLTFHKADLDKILFSEKNVIYNYISFFVVHNLYMEFILSKEDLTLDNIRILWNAIIIQLWLKNESTQNSTSAPRS